MSLGQQIFALIFTPVVVIAVLAYLGRKLLDTQINKDLEVFKANLNQTLFEHKTRYSLLQEKQALTIGELYGKIARVSSRLSKLINIFQLGDNVSLQDKINEVASMATDMQDYFYEHEIYFDDSTCTMINEVLLVLHSVYVNFSASQKGSETYQSDESGQWRSAIEEFRKKYAPLRQKLKRELRAILIGEESH